MEKPQKPLIEKYEIPLNHLDFRYIAECENAREMEKIFHILISGEEGYYAELTQCAEDKLRELKPNSRFLRKEDAMIGREALPKNEWEPVHNWQKDIKATDKLLQELQKVTSVEEQLSDLPALRPTGTIQTDKQLEENSTCCNNKKNDTEANTTKKERIKSIDYSKWDKYNPDVEILRMDLDEERQREEAECQRNTKKQNTQQPYKVCPQITEITANFTKYSKVERQTIAEGYRLKGNDYFRAKEYEMAVAEYNLCIEMCPETAAAAYNNRAIANIKLKKFLEAIEDSESCLKMEPNNVKALLRLAEATTSYGRKREAYDIYLRVLTLESSNAIARKACEELNAIYGDVLPPSNATRLQIEDVDKFEKKPQTTSSSQPKTEVPVAKAKDFDFAELIKPNRVLPNKLAVAAQTLNNAAVPKTNEQKSHGRVSKEKQNSQPEFQLRTSLMPQPKSGKILIEEI